MLVYRRVGDTSAACVNVDQIPQYVMHAIEEENARYRKERKAWKYKHNTWTMTVFFDHDPFVVSVHNKEPLGALLVGGVKCVYF
jgi:hypothetical protein